MPTRKELEALDAQESRSEPDEATWATTTDLTHITSSFWTDPDPHAASLLTADRIRAYHYMVGRMIRPFQEKHLNPASYDLTIGPRCSVDGSEMILSWRQPALEIPPNSIAFVSSREVLLIPHWLVARFNLKRNLIFEGLLMGIGPQIDPGFIGVLSAPLHNISNNPVVINLLDPFAKIDFVKTTWGLSVQLEDVKSEDELYTRAAAGTLKGFDGTEAVKLWPRDQNLRAPVSVRQPRPVKSSVREIGDRVKNFERLTNERVQKLEQETGDRIRRANLVNVAAVVATLLAFIGVAFGIIGITHSYTDSKTSDGRKATEESRTELKELKARLPARYGGTK